MRGQLIGAAIGAIIGLIIGIMAVRRPRVIAAGVGQTPNNPAV